MTTIERLDWMVNVPASFCVWKTRGSNPDPKTGYPVWLPFVRSRVRILIRKQATLIGCPLSLEINVIAFSLALSPILRFQIILAFDATTCSWKNVKIKKYEFNLYWASRLSSSVIWYDITPNTRTYTHCREVTLDPSKLNIQVRDWFTEIGAKPPRKSATQTTCRISNSDLLAFYYTVYNFTPELSHLKTVG
jgi:hypothetical protein